LCHLWRAGAIHHRWSVEARPRSATSRSATPNSSTRASGAFSLVTRSCLRGLPGGRRTGTFRPSSSGGTAQPPPFLAGALLTDCPRPEPDRLPPPFILLTVAQARRSASLAAASADHRQRGRRSRAGVTRSPSLFLPAQSNLFTWLQIAPRLQRIGNYTDRGRHCSLQ